MATASEDDADAKDAAYDDTRRMACRLAINAFVLGGDQSAINLAASTFMEGFQLEVVEKTKNRTIFRQSMPGGQVLNDYKQACEDSGGAFDVFSGVLDCVGYGEYFKKGKETIEIDVNQAQCFAPGPECTNYTALDWRLDSKQVLHDACTVQAGSIDNIDDAISSLTSSERVMPPGEPTFVNDSAGNSDARRRKCLDAFKSEFNQYPDLEDAAFDLVGKEQIQLLQNSPIYTQWEWYLNDDDSANLNNYQQLCKEASGTFDIFSGTLDCLGFGTNNKGVKTTTVIDNAAACFPSTGCSDYTLGQWKIDLFRVAHQSCNIRSSSTSEINVGNSSPLPTTAPSDIGEVERPSASHSGSDLESTVTKTQEDTSGMLTIPLFTVGLVIVALGLVVVVYHRRRRHRQHVVEYQLSSSNVMIDGDCQGDNYQDEDVELSPINFWSELYW